MNQEHQFYKEALGGLLPDKESIRINALRQTHPAHRHRWLWVAAACFAALAVICISVPSVRAAIAQWFTVNHSVQNYLAQPESARPSTSELDTLIEQSEPDETAATNSIEIAGIAPEWQEWADSLNPTIGDVLFDGQKLMVSFDMGGGAGELVLGDTCDAYHVAINMNNPGYIIMNGAKYGYGVSSDVAESESYQYASYIDKNGHLSGEGKTLAETDGSVPFTATIDFSRPAASARITLDNWPKELPDGSKEEYLAYISKLQQFDPDFSSGEYQEAPAKLTGVQQVELHLPLIATDYAKPSKVDEDGISYQGVPIGMLKLRFSFDPAAGYANVTSYEIDKSGKFKGEGTYAWTDRSSDPDYVTFVNKTADMSGVTVHVKRIDCYATGAELYVSLTCPDDWDELDKKCFLSSLIPSIKGDGETLDISHIKYGLAEAGEDDGMCIHLQMLPSEAASIDSYEITWTLERFSGYDDVPYVEGEPTRIKQDDVKGWQTASDDLTDCALSFSLKK